MAGLLEPVGINQEEYIITEKLRKFKYDKMAKGEAARLATKLLKLIADMKEK